MNGLNVLQKLRQNCKRDRPLSNSAPNHLKICSNCYATIAKGSSHSASLYKHSNRVKVEKIVQISSPFTLKRAASRDQQNSAITPLNQPKKNREVKKMLFSSADCSGMQEDLGISISQTKILLRNIRLATGSRPLKKMPLQRSRKKIDN